LADPPKYPPSESVCESEREKEKERDGGREREKKRERGERSTLGAACGGRRVGKL